MIEVFFSTKLAIVFLISIIGLAEAGEVQVTSTRVPEDLIPVDCGPRFIPPNNKFGLNV